ncbi:hypothetical protein TNCV_1064011 [Trichonephila clavipes]|nr:hypothetical protein TNCV_1064011 [Trichonephila clavipes]
MPVQWAFGFSWILDDCAFGEGSSHYSQRQTPLSKGPTGKRSKELAVNDHGKPGARPRPNTINNYSTHAAYPIKWLVTLTAENVGPGFEFRRRHGYGNRFNSRQAIYSQFGLAIHQNDHQARRRFVEWAQNEIPVVPDFHKRILFSDEAHFWLNGYVKKQNCRNWSEANPQSLVYADKPQTLDHLEDNIRRVIADIRPQMLEKVIENWASRLDYIRASRGSPMPEIIFEM